MTALEAMENAYAESGGSMAAVLVALAELQLPSMAFYDAERAMGELLKDRPHARGGDMLAVEWKAVCLRLASEAEIERAGR